MKRLPVLAVILILVGILAWKVIPETQYEKTLSVCGAYPNKSTQAVTETSRITIKLPRGLYPVQDGLLTFTTASGTAMAGWVSNGGKPGEAYGATDDCFAYYYEFAGRGIVDLIATSSVKGVPDYVVHFVVAGS